MLTAKPLPYPISSPYTKPRTTTTTPPEKPPNVDHGEETEASETSPFKDILSHSVSFNGSNKSSGNVGARSEDKLRRGCYKRRTIQTRTTTTSNLVDDGYAWQKYGQKSVLNAKFPRGYYRCTHKFDQGCQATKQVQRTDEDPPIYQITYHGNHSCRDPPKAPHIILDSTIPNDGSNSNFTSFRPTHYPNSELKYVPSFPTFPLVKQKYSHNQHELNPSLNPNQSMPIQLSDSMVFDSSWAMPALSSGSDHSNRIYFLGHNLELVDGLSSSCGDERITESTNHRDLHDAALLPLDHGEETEASETSPFSDILSDLVSFNGSNQSSGIVGACSEDKLRRGCYKGRRTIQTWTTTTSNLVDDGYAWRKYGQKSVLNAKFPRGYYRCTHKFDQGCQTTKQVQRTDEDPPIYQITYHGNHSCRDPPKAPHIILDSTIPNDGSNSNFTSFRPTHYPNSELKYVPSFPTFPLVKQKYSHNQHELNPSLNPNQSMPIQLSDSMVFDSSWAMPALSSGSDHSNRIYFLGHNLEFVEDTREGLKGECSSKSVLKYDDFDDYDFDDYDFDDDSVKDEFVDGLSSSCGNERIIVSTTNHRDRHDAALLPMDTYIHKASPQPVGLPDGGEIVQLQSIGEKSLVDFDATNNRGQSGVLVSNSKKKYTLEVSRERCMTQSLLSLVESTRRISTDFDSPDNREHLNSPVVFNSEKEDTREASKGECSTKNALSLDDSTKQNSFPDFDATINKAHLVEAYHSGPVVSLSENKNSGGALNRECIGKSVLCLEDLRQHCCGRCDDVEKSFGDSLAWTSFEVLETLAPWEQPNDCVPLLSLGRSTLGSCVQQEKSLDLPRVMQIDAVGQRVTKSSRYLEGFAAQSASSSRWPIGLPDGAHSVLLDPLEQSTQDIVHLAGAEQCSSTVSLPEKKMVRTLKRKYKTISVIVENHQQQSVALPDGGEIVGLDSSVKKPLVDFDDATTNMGFQSGVLVSYSKRRCMTLSGISGFYRTYSLAQKSFEVQETLLPPKQLRNSADTARARQIRTLMHEEPSNPRGSFPIHMHTRIGRFQRYLCPSLCPSICIRSIFWEEPNDFVPVWSPRRLTFKGCVQLEKTPYLPRLLQIDAVEQELTKSPRYSGGSTAQSASSSLWPIGLPGGRHFVVLDPLEQSTKNVAHAASVDQCSPTVSLLEKKMLRKTLKRKCRTICVIFEIHQQHFGRKCEGSAKSFHATCIGKKHGTNQVSTVKRIHKQHRIHQWPFRHKWATRKRYSAGDKRSFQVSRESVNEKLDSRLQFIHMSQCAKADGSGPTVSNSEKGRLREALKCDSLTNTRSLNDLREHFGARRKDAAKGLCDSLALKSFEVLDSLPLGEQSNSIRNLARRRTLTHKHCVRLKKLQDLQQSLLSDCSGELAAQAALGLSDGGHIPSLPEKKIVRKTLKRKSRTMSVLTLEDDQQHVGRRWEDDAKFLGAKRICRQLAIDRKPTEKRILRQHGTCRCQFKQSAIDLPDGGHILSLSKKKIVRKTLKRKCRNMSVLRSEYHHHVDSKWDDAVKSLGAKHIYRQLVIHRVSRAKRIRKQHGFHRWPFQRNLATWKGYFLGGERPDDGISLSMDGKLVSRLQLIHISWLGRFSPQSPALPPEGEIVEPPLALSSSQLPSISIRAHLGGQDRSGSSTSHSQNERTRDQPEGRKRKIKNLTIEDLRPHVRLPRAKAARELQVSESSFKRLCRRLKIEQWPKLPPGKEILKPPDPPGRNAGQIGMVNEFGNLPEPIEVSRPPDPCERNTRQTEEENDVVVNVHVQNHQQDNFDSPIGWFEGNDSTDLLYVLQGIEVDQVIDEPLLSSAYPNPNPDVFLQPQVTLIDMVSGNMGIPNNQRNSLASPAETRLEGHGTVSSDLCPNPNPNVFLQPQVALTHMVSGKMGIPNNQRNSLASPAETRFEGHGAVSCNHCPNPNPDVFLQPQVALTQMVSGNMGIPNNQRNSLASPAETRLEGHGAVSSDRCPNPNPNVFLQPQVALTHMVSGNMRIPNNQRNSLASPAETRFEGHGVVSSNQAMIQPMSTLPQMTPPSTSSEDTSFVMLKVYGLGKRIIFPFPLTSGINELKGEVAMRLNLQKDSFDMNYKDDEGENIFIPLDMDLRYYLTKPTSLVNSVIKLWVVNNDANPTNLCGSCGGSLMR